MKKITFPAAIVIVLAITTMLFAGTVYAQQSPKLNDAEIASAAVVANQNDIDFAKVAKQKSKNAEVIQFAETMIRDHQAVIDQAVALVTKLKVTPQDNAVSKKLASDAAATKETLLAKSANDFDKAYIDNEVAYHKAVIAAVENVLIPQATNGELKSLLQNVVPALKAHLEHAEMIQKKLS